MNKSFKTLWQQHLFRDNGFSPTSRLPGLILTISVPLSLGSLLGFGWMPFFTANILILLISLFDLWLLPSRKQFTCRRIISGEIEREHPFQVVLQLSNRSTKRISFHVIDNLPESFGNPFPLSDEIPAGETITLTYSSQAAARGDYTIDKAYFRYHSGLGLWQKQVIFPVKSAVRVIPDMTKVRGHLTTAQKFLTDQGLKAKHRRIGSGEFSQIRSYVPGDDPRKINWRQTAKLQELMTNVYEPEHGKYLTLMLDCGRTMGVELAQGNRLEQAMEAVLSVAAVALQLGDYVSVLAFSNQIKAYVPPGKTLAHLRTILQTVYNLKVDPAESDYARAFLHLETVQKRQGLMLLFSDLEPFLFAANPPVYLQRVSRKHQFLLLSIADPMLNKLLKTKSGDIHRAMLKSAAQREILHKQQSIQRWGRTGIQILEVPEEHLAAQAVSHYIDVLNRGIL